MMKNYVDILRSIELNFELDIDHKFLKNTAIISVGKSAAFMYKKFIKKYLEAFEIPKIIILPENSDSMELDDVIFSTHPQISKLSFSAGEHLLEFMKSSEINKFIVLISGGSSALIEHSSDHKLTINSNNYLLSSGKDIVEINLTRIKNSLIKGGKLASMFPEKQFIVFSMSDIPFENGDKLVGSMPFYSENSKNSTLIKCADCITLRDHLAPIFELSESDTDFIDRFTGTVKELSEIIRNYLKNMERNLYVSTEPTIKVSGKGKGGRMSHLALSILPYFDNSVEFYALSSDGIDGNSDFAGAVITELKRKYSENEIAPFIKSFNSATFLEKESLALKTGYTGINLNDFVIIRKKQEGPA